MKFNDAVSGGALLALALAVIGYSLAMPKMHGQFVGPGLFPGLCGGALGIGAVILIVRGLRLRAADADAHPWLRLEAWVGDPAAVLRYLAIPIFILAYVLVSERIGFVPVAFVGLVLLFAIAGVRWRTTLIVSAATTAAVYYAFAVILRVPLPRVDVLGLPF